MYSLLEIGDKDFTQDKWIDFYRLLERLHNKYNATLSSKDWKDLKNRMLDSEKDRRTFFQIVLFEDNQPLLFADYRLLNKRTPQQVVYFTIQGDFEDLPLEAEKIIVSWYVSEFTKKDIKFAFGILFNDHLHKVMQKWNTPHLCRMNQYYLYHDRVNHEILERWIKDISFQSNGFNLRFYDEIPDELIPDFVEYVNTQLGRMPKEESGGTEFSCTVEEFPIQQQWYRDTNSAVYTYILFNENNEIIASSGVHINRNKTKFVHQVLTGIREDYCGKGLAKYLKAKMYYKIKEDFPENEAIITEMRAVNKPILHINEQMGFYLKRFGLEYKLELSNLENRLKQLS